MITVNNINDKGDKIRFVCISDTHGKINFKIPDVHAGDMSRKNTMAEYEETFRWLSTLPHTLKIITGGNHDHFLDPQFPFDRQRATLLEMMEQYGLVYLQHQCYQLPEELGSFTLFVSPYAPIHLGGAFMLSDMSSVWDTIPPVDILVTHTPPFGMNDKIVRGRHVGCKFLKEKIDTVVKPRVSICGHIHEAQGYTFDQNQVLYINACLSDHKYRAVNKPITFDL
ncbi:hypothetical protein HPULCUR_004780 [Helicostylum pulchrum]|uniref:Calcineurin-like phosphoesterase domain-containing protein n=1 Tax=Helicostylum pulchrum TaxID=562976 RepID=A0ABP9XX66_9FUNG